MDKMMMSGSEQMQMGQDNVCPWCGSYGMTHDMSTDQIMQETHDKQMSLNKMQMQDMGK